MTDCALCRAKAGDVPSKHYARIVKQNAKMHPAMAAVLGGPSPEEAARLIRDHKKHGR